MRTVMVRELAALSLRIPEEAYVGEAVELSRYLVNELSGEDFRISRSRGHELIVTSSSLTDEELKNLVKKTIEKWNLQVELVEIR